VTFLAAAFLAGAFFAVAMIFSLLDFQITPSVLKSTLGDSQV
jgi:hypothetical protein